MIICFLNLLSKKAKSTNPIKKSMSGILFPVRIIELNNKIEESKKVRTNIFLFFENKTEEKIKKKEKIWR